MTKITVLGGTGYAGSNIVAEAAERGHEVTAVSRHLPEKTLNQVKYVTGDILEESFLESLLEGSEVVISALAARGNMLGQVGATIKKLIELSEKYGIRIGVIGGAGSLYTSDERTSRVLDQSTFPEQARPEAVEMAQVLESLEATPDSVQWFFISPAANFGSWNAGERTGKFRIGSDVLLTDESGVSDISGADLAVAIVDEIENPQHHRSRFTVAY